MCALYALCVHWGSKPQEGRIFQPLSREQLCAETHFGPPRVPIPAAFCGRTQIKLQIPVGIPGGDKKTEKHGQKSAGQLPALAVPTLITPLHPQKWGKLNLSGWQTMQTITDSPNADTRWVYSQLLCHGHTSSVRRYYVMVHSHSSHAKT